MVTGLPHKSQGRGENRLDCPVRVERQAKDWLAGRTPAASLKTSGWSTQEWLHFLGSLPDRPGRERMKELDDAFRLTRSANSEITFRWLLLAVRNGFEPAYPRLEEFLTSMGRRKFLKPLYEELVKTPAGRGRALRIYREAGCPVGWDRWIREEGEFLGMRTYGESGPAKDVYAHFGITSDRLVELGRSVMDRVGARSG